MENSSLAGLMAWLSSLAKCQNKTKKTRCKSLTPTNFSEDDFFVSTRDIFSIFLKNCDFFAKKSPYFSCDFLMIYRLLNQIAIYCDFGYFLVIFVTEV
jgi:hypothetical protein